MQTVDCILFVGAGYIPFSNPSPVQFGGASAVYPIGLLLALTIVSGFIAYVGDVVGRRLGKKRLTIFHLRPRHTAMVVSVITGILIFTVTVLVLTAVSREARIALFELDALLKEREELRTEVTKLRSSYRLWKSKAERLSYELKIEQEKTTLAQRQHAQVSKELANVRKQLSAAEARLKDMHRMLQSTEALLTKTQGRLKIALSELRRTESALKETMAELRSRQDELLKVRQEIAKADETAKRSLATTRKQLDELRRQVSELQEMKAEFERYRKSLDTYIASMLVKGELIYKTEETVLIGVVDGSMPKEKILDKLERLLDEADSMARKRGASAQGNERAVKIFGMLVKLPGSDEPTLFTEKDILNIVADNIKSVGESVIVEIYAKRNVMAGEQVPVDIRLYRNQLVFRSGEVLASKKIDGRASVGELMQELAYVLYGELSRIARERGLLMRTDSERPSYGVISFLELGEAVEQLKRINGPAILEARAKKDTFTIGPLEVELRVVPAG
jgi:uncharacterized protein (DUF3084 family)